MLGISPDQQAFLIKIIASSAVLVLMISLSWFANNKHRLVVLSHSLYL